MLRNIKSENKKKGDFGEQIVEEYLNKSGYEILSKNFKCNFGEVDVIFRDKNEVVFAEVKTRNGLKYGYPAESVTYFKRKHICNVANYFIYINGLSNKKTIELFENYKYNYNV